MKCFYSIESSTVFPHIVAAATILFWIHLGNYSNFHFPYVMKTWIVSSLDEETIQGEETNQGRKLYEEIRYTGSNWPAVLNRLVPCI